MSKSDSDMPPALLDSLLAAIRVSTNTLLIGGVVVLG